MNNNKKATKRALLTSVMALVMCVVMLVGTTFAWFTDTASTAVNKIQAGNLDIELEYATEWNTDGSVKTWSKAEGETLQFKKAAGHESEEVLWEPGCRYVLPELRIVNKGNLALKYKISISGAKDATPENDKNDLKLLDVIDWTYSVIGAGGANVDKLGTERYLAAKTADRDVFDTLTIEGQMQKSAGNDYQGMAIEGIAITVVATQDTVESDSFSKDYDKDATYPVVVSQNELNTSLTLDALEDENGKVSPVEVTLGNTAAEEINYSQNNSGYTGKGVMLGSTNLNKYAATPAAAGQYKFTFKDGTITSAATGYGSIDNYKNTSVYMLVPGNSDVVFENMTFKGVVSFDIQKYTSPWSNLNSITFKNCTFNGIIIGTCPASNVTFDRCTFNAYTNTESANNSNPIWWREDTEGSGANANPIKTFTFVNNEVIGTRPVKIERIGKTVSPVFTIKNNTFDISKQAGDTATKNMAINIGMGENPNLPFTLIDEGNTISANTAALYTASLTGGSNWYVEKSGMKVLDGNGNEKVITAMVWKTTTGATFELKSVD
ncbi:MAG: SipW-dependent-type signal peptide-containing protein [Oscillospiraceae bacterium]